MVAFISSKKGKGPKPCHVFTKGVALQGGGGKKKHCHQGRRTPFPFSGRGKDLSAALRPHPQYKNQGLPPMSPRTSRNKPEEKDEIQCREGILQHITGKKRKPNLHTQFLHNPSLCQEKGRNDLRLRIQITSSLPVKGGKGKKK